MKTLPFEIIQIVDTFLFDDERVICMSVCWNWYTIFKQLLYKNITLHTQYQSKLFYNTLKSPFHRLDSAAIHIKSLDILFDSDSSGDNDTKPCNRALTEIALLCPHLTSLTLPCGYNLYDLRLFNNSLTTLTLSLKDDRFDAITILSYLSQLHTLSLQWKKKALTMGDLETIHSQLQQLQYLSLSVEKLSRINHTEMLVSPANLLGISIDCQEYIYAIEPLFLYAAHKYPELEHLTLTTQSATSLISLEDEESENDGATLLDRYRVYITFAQQCRKLDTLVLRNILPDTILLEALGTVGTQLKKLSVDTIYGLPRSLFELIIRVTKPSLTSFDLLSSLRTRDTRLLRDSLSCLRLTDLTLGRQTNPIPMATLLDHCRYLKRCAIQDSVIQLDVENNDRWVHSESHGLAQLVLEKVMFENSSLFDYLSRRCTKLIRLSVINSICSTNNNSQAVYLHMPYSSLISLDIDRLYLDTFTRKKEDQVQQLALKIHSKRRDIQCEPIDELNTQWYDNGKHVQRGNRLLSRKQFVSICCQSVDRLFMNGRRLI